MPFLKRLGYFLVGLSLGLIFLAFFLRKKTDETGAELESKAIFVSALPPRKFIFDKPFLLMLIRQDASMPYFVLWVNNADVLVPFQS